MERPVQANRDLERATDVAGVEGPLKAPVEPFGYDNNSGGLRAALPIKNTVVVEHGGGCCSWRYRIFLAGQARVFQRLVNLGLEPEHIVFGAGELLEEAVERSIKTMGPELVIIHNAAIPLLIGDDTAGVAKRVTEKTGVKVVAVDNPNYDGRDMDGWLNGVRAYVNQLMVKRETVKEKSVNIIGSILGEVTWKQDAVELKRMLEGIGLSVNCTLVGPDTTLQEIIDAPQAQANVMVFPEFGLPIAQLMQEKFGTPYVETALPPVGLKACEEWISKIAEFFGLERQAKAFIEQELIWVGERLVDFNLGGFNNMIGLVTGKTYALEAQPFWIPAMVKWLYEDLGMYPYVIAFHAKDEYSTAHLERILKDYNLSPEVQTDGDHYAWREALLRDYTFGMGDPLITIGTSYTAVRLSRMTPNPQVSVYRFAYPAIDNCIVTDRPFLGFKGFLVMTEDIYNIVLRQLYGSL